MAFLGPIAIYQVIHGTIANISKNFKSCFLLHYQKCYVCILCLTFFQKLQKSAFII